MRKLRDQGHFKNSMQTKIDQDKQLDEMNEQLDRLRAELQVIWLTLYRGPIICTRPKSSPAKWKPWSRASTLKQYATNVAVHGMRQKWSWSSTRTDLLSFTLLHLYSIASTVPHSPNEIKYWSSKAVRMSSWRYMIIVCAIYLKTWKTILYMRSGGQDKRLQCKYQSSKMVSKLLSHVADLVAHWKQTAVLAHS